MCLTEAVLPCAWRVMCPRRYSSYSSPSVPYKDDTRWRSVLQKAELKELAASCPGAAQVVSVRKTCVGYFLAE